MKVLAANWKMHKTRAEAWGFFETVGSSIKDSAVRKIVAASPTLLETCQRIAPSCGIEVFSQNCAFETSGAFTGEVSPSQLKELGIKGTLIGHSERRSLFGETAESAVRRSLCALQSGLDVIFCCGETLEERKQGNTRTVLASQLQGLKKVDASLIDPTKATRFIIAYEPVWAIGTGVNATNKEIEETLKWIGEILAELSLPKLPMLYGGSVKPSNFNEIAAVAGVSGALVGGASLEPASFGQLHSALL